MNFNPTHDGMTDERTVVILKVHLWVIDYIPITFLYTGIGTYLWNMDGIRKVPYTGNYSKTMCMLKRVYTHINQMSCLSIPDNWF
ncbi:MAG: hypothetical protein P8X91_04445 [Candidatus Bathyarchaeota archaeon]